MHATACPPRVRHGHLRLEPAAENPEGTVVVEVPVDAGEGVRTARDLSMWEQLSFAAFLQRYWADNQASIFGRIAGLTEKLVLLHVLLDMEATFIGHPHADALVVAALVCLPRPRSGEQKNPLNCVESPNHAFIRKRMCQTTKLDRFHCPINAFAWLQVSCTITFDPSKEGQHLAHALDYFQYQLKGVSFLPRMDYGAFPQVCV